MVVLGLACLVAAVLVGAWWWQTSRVAPVDLAGEQGRGAAADSTGGAGSGSKGPPEGPAPVSAPPPAIPEDRDALAPEIQRYLEAHEYPPHSGVLTAGSVDLLHPNRRFEREKPVPGSRGSSPADTFLWTADRLYYSGGETVRVRFAARRGGRPAPVSALLAQAWPEGGSGALGSPLPIALEPDGDAFVGSLPLIGSLGGHHGPIALAVNYQLSGGQPEEELIRVFATPEARIPARFTGSFRDRSEGGSLVVEVGIEVGAAGFYRIDANLRDASGEPVAFGHWKGDLDEKSGFVPIEFFGKVLHDAGAPGPYRVTEVRGYRFLDGRFPDRERMRDAESEFISRAWALADFSEAPYESEHLARMVALLQSDLDAGLSIERPPDAEAEPGGEVPPAAEAAAEEEVPPVAPAGPAEEPAAVQPGRSGGAARN
jgi:hypothetical protein